MCAGYLSSSKYSSKSPKAVNLTLKTELPPALMLYIFPRGLDQPWSHDWCFTERSAGWELPYLVYEPDFCSFPYNSVWSLLSSWKSSTMEKIKKKRLFILGLFLWAYYKLRQSRVRGHDSATIAVTGVGPFLKTNHCSVQTRVRKGSWKWYFKCLQVPEHCTKSLLRNVWSFVSANSLLRLRKAYLLPSCLLITT